MVALDVIVFTGAAVRVTGSGLGCPDWPNCYHDGRLTPELNSHAYIEFGNRMLTTLVSITSIAAAVLVFARRPFRRDLVLPALLLPLGVAAQAVMGGLTVIYGLAPGWVIAHLLLSMAILVAAGTLVWRARPEPTTGREPRRASLGVARGVWAMFALGGADDRARHRATAAGPHAGGEGTGDIVNRLEFNGAGTLNWLVERHGVLAGALGLLAVGLWFAARRSGADRHLVQRLTRICLLMAAQGALGIAQFSLELPAELVWVHVALATLLWVGIVLAAIQAGSPLRGRARGAVPSRGTPLRPRPRCRRERVAEPGIPRRASDRARRDSRARPPRDALAITRDAGAEQRVEQQHGQRRAGGHREALDPDGVGLERQHHDPAEEQQRRNPVADEGHHVPGPPPARRPLPRGCSSWGSSSACLVALAHGVADRVYVGSGSLGHCGQTYTLSRARGGRAPR